MNKAKKLTLQKKTIRDLTTTELDSVAGGLTIIVGPNACGSTNTGPTVSPCGSPKTSVHSCDTGGPSSTNFVICG